MKHFVLLFLVASFAFVSCGTDDSGDGGTTGSFDRGKMLANWADNIIVPSFENFSNSTTVLEQKAQAFVQNPGAASLVELRNAFEQGYIQFQTVAMFEIGRAESENYRFFLNTYPADANTIQQKIQQDNFNLQLPSSYDEQGFPALDFLINGLGQSDSEILEFYTTNSKAASYKQYLLDVSKRINLLTGVVLADWKTSFRDSFVSNTSSSSTGSVDRFTNDYVMYYEKFLRSGKIGIPAGAFTGSAFPQNVEAVYSAGLSKTLYLKSLEAVQNFFNGKHFSGTGQGLSYKQYLDYLNSVKNGQDLASLINNQFNAIRQQANNLNPDFKEQIQNNNTLMLQAFDELQKNVVLLKVDMMQALSISVDYVDSDGD